MKKVILDTDPGIDDALAITLLLNSPEIEVLAITTVAGNTTVDKTTRNALRVLEVLKRRDVPVARGSEKPLIRELVTGEVYHGSDGLGDTGMFPEPTQRPVDKDASELIADLVLSEPPYSVTLVAIGPLTNVAKAMLTRPEVAKRLKEVVIMGGCYGLTPYAYGNVTPVSEFNFYADPEAAHIVLNSSARIKLFGLDVTHNPKTAITVERLGEIERYNTFFAKYIAKVAKPRADEYTLFFLHDPLTVASVIDEKIVRKSITGKVYIELHGELTRGQSIVERRPWIKVEPNAEIVVEVDEERFMSLFMDRVVRVKL